MCLRTLGELGALFEFKDSSPSHGWRENENEKYPRSICQVVQFRPHATIQEGFPLKLPHSNMHI